VTIRNRKSGFYIGVGCPGCGAELELESDFFVLECSHCGSVLRLVMPDIPPAYVVACKKERQEIRFLVDRHLKNQGCPLTRSGLSFTLFYYPYWKMDAILLKVKEETLRASSSGADAFSADMDLGDLFSFGGAGGGYRSGEEASSSGPSAINVSLAPYTSTLAAGPDMAGIPTDVGLRAEYVRMKPFKNSNDDAEGEFIPVVKPWEEVLSAFTKSNAVKGWMGMGGEKTKQRRLFRPRGSVVYFPYFAVVEPGGGRRFIVDGLSGRLIHTSADKDAAAPNEMPSVDAMEFGELSIIFHRCPTCGVDLPPTRSHVYICHNCHSVVSLDAGTVFDQGVCFSPSPKAGVVQMLPFWLFKVSSDVVMAVAKQPKGVAESDWLAVPGFRVANLAVMRQLCQRMTAALPHFTRQPADNYDQRFQPVDIGLSEAAALAEICLYCEKAVKAGDFPAETIGMKPEKAELIYIPFAPQNYFYVDTVVDAVTFPQAAIAR